MDDETKRLVMHTDLKLLGSTVMFSDTPEVMPFRLGNNVSLAVVSNDQAQLRSIFGKLSQGGEIVMELQETPWSKCYGSLTDKFGVEWQVDYDESCPGL